MSQLRIGCSGWVYKHWAGAFYPQGTREAARLEYYASRFDTAEINASFYRLPSEAMVAGWARRVPERFVFAWKVSRFITHNKKLNDCEDPVALVFGRMAPLGGRLGPALIQLPPQLRRNDERLAGFLKLLRGRGRCAVEFRHDSWYAPEVFRILAEFDAALCVSDHHAAPAPWESTASFVYIRGHGPGGRYRGRYPEAELAGWARRIGGWRAQGRDVYAYFDNDVKAAAPVDAQALMLLTGVRPYHQRSSGARKTA